MFFVAVSTSSRIFIIFIQLWLIFISNTCTLFFLITTSPHAALDGTHLIFRLTISASTSSQATISPFLNPLKTSLPSCPHLPICNQFFSFWFPVASCSPLPPAPNFFFRLMLSSTTGIICLLFHYPLAPISFPAVSNHVFHIPLVFSPITPCCLLFSVLRFSLPFKTTFSNVTLLLFQLMLPPLPAPFRLTVSPHIVVRLLLSPHTFPSHRQLYLSFPFSSLIGTHFHLVLVLTYFSPHAVPPSAVCLLFPFSLSPAPTYFFASKLSFFPAARLLFRLKLSILALFSRRRLHLLTPRSFPSHRQQPLLSSHATFSWKELSLFSLRVFPPMSTHRFFCLTLSIHTSNCHFSPLTLFLTTGTHLLFCFKLPLSISNSLFFLHAFSSHQMTFASSFASRSSAKIGHLFLFTLFPPVGTLFLFCLTLFLYTITFYFASFLCLLSFTPYFSLPSETASSFALYSPIAQTHDSYLISYSPFFSYIFLLRERKL